MKKEKLVFPFFFLRHVQDIDWPNPSYRKNSTLHCTIIKGDSSSGKRNESEDQGN